MIIYLDVFVIQNFIVNFFLLYITSQTIKIKPKIILMVISAVFGAFYAVISTVTKAKFLFLLPVKFIIAMIMISIVLKKKNLLTLIKAVLLYNLYSMLIAGICLFVEISSNTSLSLVLNKFSYKTLLVSIMLIYILIHRIVTYIQDRKELINLVYDVDIVTEDEITKVKAFLDTGNELREPATNLPVMIVDEGVLSNSKIKSEEKFFIPYKVVNGFGGKLEGFKPKYINVHRGNEIEKREVIIAFCSGVLSDLNDYNALLSRGIL